MSKLLIAERPLIVLPGLAVAIGLKEAIFVQQVHYWISEHGHKRLGKKWVYNTLDGWLLQFPFLTMSTLQRTIKSCKAQSVVIVGRFNRMSIDQTRWYTIDYRAISRLGQNDHMDRSKWPNPLGQNDHMDRSKWPNPLGQNDHMRLGQNDHTNNHRVPKTTQRVTAAEQAALDRLEAAP